MLKYLNIIFIFLFSVQSIAAEASKNSPGVYSPDAKAVTQVFKVSDVIWSFDFIDKNTLIYTLRQGQIFIYEISTKKHTELPHPRDIHAKGQGGMMDVKVSPSFKSDALIYFSFSKPGKKNLSTTEVARAGYKKGKLVDWHTLFTAQPFYSTSHHYGSRIAFDHDGHIFISIGDRGHRDKAQSLETHNGKIIRLKLDGQVPDDNPWVKTKNALPEIWSHGHRNPQGIFWHASSNTLWESEHGPKGGDEINKIIRGKNYGWPVITHGREYHGPKIGEGTQKAGMIQPIYHYTPSIAPSSLMVYSGKKNKALKDWLCMGALALQHINCIDPLAEKPTESRFFVNTYGRVRYIAEDTQGDILFSTDAGVLYRFDPEPPMRADSTNLKKQ